MPDGTTPDYAEADLRPPCVVLADTWDRISDKFPGLDKINVNFAIISLSGLPSRPYSILTGQDTTPVNNTSPLAFPFGRDERPLEVRFHFRSADIDWRNPSSQLFESIYWNNPTSDSDLGGSPRIRLASQIWTFRLDPTEVERVQVELKGPYECFQNLSPEPVNNFPVDPDLLADEYFFGQMRNIWWANGWPTAE